MFKKTLLATALTCGALTSALAAGSNTTVGNFNVGVTLTPKCEIFNGSGATPTISNLALSYTSFQTAPSTGSTNFQIRCTNAQAYSLALDGASFTDGTTGLAYTLNLTSAATHASAANASLNGLSGNGTSGQTYYVHGTVASGQDGTVSAGTANNVRSLTITY